jgi:hypothetical protein
MPVSEVSMHKHRLQLGIFMIASHFFILVAVIALWVFHGFLFEEMTTTLGLVGPLFAGYTTVILAYIIDHPNVLVDDGPALSTAFRVLSFSVPALFVIVVFVSILLWSFKIGFTEFDQFKVLVGLIEGGFGVYVGQFIYALFKKPNEPGL